MSYTQENGYLPPSFDQLVTMIRENINSVMGTQFTEENFVGTGWYKFTYAILQLVQAGEIRTGEIFLKVQEYIRLTNQRIQRPSVSYPGLIESFAENGFLVSVKEPTIQDAGRCYIAVDVDDSDPNYPEMKENICFLISQFITAGIITLGDEGAGVTLSNGQTFTIRFSLPDRQPIKLRLIALKSNNTFLRIPSDEEIRQIVFDNINERYRLGLNFEPQRYFTLSDAPWAGEVVLEWSDDDGSTWQSTIHNADFDDLFTFGLEDIQVTIN